MDSTVRSFKGYGKVDEDEDRAYKRKVRRRLIILCISSVILVAAVIGVVAGTLIVKNRNEDSTPDQLTSSSATKAVCDATQYPDSCSYSVSKYEATHNSSTTDPIQIFRFSLFISLDELISFANYTSQLASQATDSREQQAFQICGEVLDDAIGVLNDTISMFDAPRDSKILPTQVINDLRTWLSTVIAHQQTCLDSLAEVNSTHLGDMQLTMQNSTEYTSNSLAIVTKVVSILSKFKFEPHNRRLLSFDEGGDSGFPTWISAADRRLLQAPNPTPNIIVAQDGTGNYKTISDAVEAIPDKSASRFVIYVKAGVYAEQVLLKKSKWNVMMYGDGMTKTIVTGKKNFIDGTPTFATATFAVQGLGFMARDMGFQNTAGAIKHQAVAFRSTSDKSAIYRCWFDAYQDTLYSHANRQFFRDCTITGTVDFIFGYAATIIQNSSILPRQPMNGQYDTLTAQGKADPNMVSGISIQGCTIAANGNLTAQTYLGRPWKNYSTTVFMESTLASFINPKGWIEWIPGVTPPRTIFYGEYSNTGPGSNTSGRVTWPGYRPALTSDAAGKFTVNSFIQGSTWLPSFGVPFNPSL